MTHVRSITSFPEKERNNAVISYGTQYFCYLKRGTKGSDEQVEDKTMAATTSTGLFNPAPFAANSFLPTGASARVAANRRRRITPEAGHALEILGHAIEYLTDEFVHEGGSFSANDNRLKAVQLLMAVNRQVYFECPEVPSLAERCRSFLHLRAS
jgi:hypothetical protein